MTEEQRMEFSIVRGGALYRLEQSLGLVGPENLGVHKRAIIFATITWLPLAILSIIQGAAVGATYHDAFLPDFAAHARFLVAGPLLIIAEAVAQRRMQCVADRFKQAGLLEGAGLVAFNAARVWTLRLTASRVPDLIILLIIALIGTQLRGLLEDRPGMPAWHSLTLADGKTVSLVGWWYTFLSVPLFQFLLLRWLWRLSMWGSFLFRVSRLPLRIVPTHPDGAGGLRFLGDAPPAFAVIVFALATVLAAGIENRIVYDGATLESFYPLIGAFVAVSLIIFIGPLLAFMKPLVAARREGMREYDTFMSHVGRTVAAKWLAPGRRIDAEVLECPDFSILTDLSQCAERVRAMAIVPFTTRSIIPLAIAGLMPMLPVVATVIPLRDVLLKVIKLLL